MESKNIALLITSFLLIILGVVLLPTTASLVLSNTATITANNEVHAITTAFNSTGSLNVTASNFTVTNAPTDWKTTDCPLTSISVTNGTGSALTASTDYNAYAASGIIQFLDTDAMNITNFASQGVNNNSLITYTYCGDGYLTSGWQRTILNLVPGFFALALLLVGIGLFFSVAKEEGLINL